MQKWLWISLLLTVFGFFKEFRPSEPFVTDYLIDYKNFTKDTIIHVAYPIATYTYLGTLPIVFLVTDFLRYKFVIIIEGIAFVLTYALMIWGNGLTVLKIIEVLYGIASSTEVAYYTYIYAKVERKYYKKVTSYTYTATLIGNFVAAGVSQLLVSTGTMDYHQLNYLTLSSVGIALLISIVLPGVKHSMYFYRPPEISSFEDLASNTSNHQGTDQNQIENIGFIERIKRVCPVLWNDFKQGYSNSYVLKWSIWWAIASAAFLQVLNYIQALWKEINQDQGELYNGAVDAVHTILSAIFALSIGYVNIPWYKWGEIFLCVMSLFQGALLVLIAQTDSLMVAYVGYIIYRTAYQVMITVASAEVAQGISDDSYGLIFGINRFIALIFQTILTLLFSDESGFALGERDQFLVYGIYSGFLGVIFAAFAGYTFIKFGTVAGANNNYNVYMKRPERPETLQSNEAITNHDTESHEA